MTLLQASRKLIDLGHPWVETADVAALLKINRVYASQVLNKLEKHGEVIALMRGKWIVKNSNFNPLTVADFLTQPKESYISLWSALFYHGLIEQVPTQIYAITQDRSKKVKTKLGVVSFHHVGADLFQGYEFVSNHLKMATPEKALVDTLYLSPSKSREFASLPEIEFSNKFSWKKAISFAEKIPSLRTRVLVLKRIQELRGKV